MMNTEHNIDNRLSLTIVIFQISTLNLGTYS
jgi:hypothetical protein